MMDSFYELLVPHKRSQKDTLIFILSIVAIIIPFLFYMILGPFTMLVAVVIGVASYFLVWSKRNVEYEYSLLNHDLEIDVIYNQAKRKKVTSFDLLQAELIAPYHSPRMDRYRQMSPTDYSSGTKNENVYGIIITKDQRAQCFLIELDKEMKEHFSSFLPRTFFMD